MMNALHLQMYVIRTFTKTKKSVLCAEYPNSSKFHLSKWKTYFSQFIDKFLKIEEVEYLMHYVKLKMWPRPILCKFPLFFQHFWMLMLVCTLFPPIYTEIENTGILNVALGWIFQFFPIDERDKNLGFSRLGSTW